jgi:hypothetical protein
MASDPYNVPVSIFRNRGWQASFTPPTAPGSGDAMALVVLLDGRTVLANVEPTLNPATGQVSFLCSDYSTSSLVPTAYLSARDTGYSYQFLYAASGMPGYSAVFAAGDLTVLDSPVFPSGNIPAS